MSIKENLFILTAFRNRCTKSVADSTQLLGPIGNIRYLNYKVTVRGEVAGPTVINDPDEEITLRMNFRKKSL